MLRTNAIPILVGVGEAQFSVQGPRRDIALHDLQVGAPCSPMKAPSKQLAHQGSTVAATAVEWIGDEVEDPDQLAIEHRQATPDSVQTRQTLEDGQQLRLLAGRENSPQSGEAGIPQATHRTIGCQPILDRELQETEVRGGCVRRRGYDEDLRRVAQLIAPLLEKGLQTWVREGRKAEDGGKPTGGIPSLAFTDLLREQTRRGAERLHRVGSLGEPS
jgi:hypothetical protein